MADKLMGKKGSELGDQIAAKPGHLDEHDPIFDSESEDDDCYFAKFEPSEQFDRAASYAQECDHPAKIGKAKMRFKEFVEKVKSVLEEFFATGVVAETLESLKKFESPHYHDYFPVLAIRKALDKAESEQQRTAELLTVLYDSNVLTRSHLSRGFEKLIQSVEDLQLDVPDAADRLMTFFMCAEEDNLVDVYFIHRLPETFLEFLRPTAQDDAAVKQQLSELREFKSACSWVEPEFFNSGDKADIEKFLSEHPVYLRHEFVKHLVKASFDRTDWEREMVSKALNDCYGTILGPDDIQLGFSRLVGSVEDLCLDCPEAPILLSKFLMRAVVDEIIPPIFVKSHKRLHIGGAAGLITLNKFQGWLKDKKGHMLSQQFRKIWTGTDPQRQEARDFKQEVRTTVFEFFDTGDYKEAQQCFNQMDLSPDQATEVTRKLMTFAMERGSKECEAVINLIQHLVQHSELSKENVKLGFDQTYKNLDDLVIDVPSGADRLKYFQKEAITRGLLPSSYEDPMSQAKREENGSVEKTS